MNVIESIRSVAKDNDSIAIRHNDIDLNYKELVTRIDGLSNYLLDTYSIKKEDVIIIYMGRSIYSTISTLSVLNIAAAFLPVDKKTPLDRLRKIIQISNAKLVLSDVDIFENISAQCINIQCIDCAVCQSKELYEFDENNLAYVIFTSGSTGVPKGAMIEHIGMNNHISEKIRLLNLSSRSVVGFTASISFDISVWQMIAVLCVGGIVDIIDDATVLNVRKFVKKLEQDHITVIELVPTYISILLKYLKMKQIELNELQYLVSTGESLSYDLAKEWNENYHRIPIVNAYGPTEASDDVTHCCLYDVNNYSQIPIGKPIKNAFLSIHDFLGNEILDNYQVGELWIRGICVGRGYINNIEETEKHFVYDFKSNCKIYKTGDMVFKGDDENYYFVGRRDTQIKRRGYRIEVEEVERIIKDSTHIKDVCVVWNQKKDEMSALYISDNELVMDTIYEELKGKIPDYMMPQLFTRVDSFPVSINGKIDRKKIEDMLDQ